MTRWWLRFGVAGAGAFALLGILLPSGAGAQATERYRVMVTNLVPIDDADDDFGKDLAKSLRKLINEFPTHQPVDEGDIKDMAKKFDLDHDELDCIRSVQLATQMNVELVFCGQYTENDDTKEVSLSGVRFSAPGGTNFPIPDRTWGEKEYEAAAQEISGSFRTYVAQLRHKAFCADYYASKDWASAETNCTRALEMNPDDAQVRLVYAMLHREQGRDQEAYDEAMRVVELDPLNEQALQLAGYQATQMGRRDEGRELYTRYLQLDPGNAAVRMNIAYELATAGDPEGAMLLIEEGLSLEGDNVDLLLQHASFATRAAQDIRGSASADEPLSPEVSGLYRKAVASYEKAYEVQGVEMDGDHLRNMIAGYYQLDLLDQAVSMAERALETHAEEVGIWSLYANILQKADRLDDAVAALDHVETLDADLPNVKMRQATWLLAADRVDEAFPYFQQAVQKGEQPAGVVARTLFARGHSRGIIPKNWSYAERMINLSKQFESQLSDEEAGELDFWHGYLLYNQGLEQGKPQTLQTAQATLPKFREAARLFGLARVAAYTASQPSISLQQFRDATQQYIEIQSAIIKRGN